MSTIKRVGFQKSVKDSLDIEIVDLHNFFKNIHKDKLYSAHRLDFYIMMYIISGVGKHEIDFNIYDIKKGDVIFIAQNQVHRFLPDLGVEGYILLFTEEFLYGDNEMETPDFIERLNTPRNTPVIEVNTKQNETNRILIDLLYKEYQENESGNNLKLIKALFKSFMLTFRGSPNTEEKATRNLTNKRFIEYKNLVETHYKKKKTVKEYADMMLVTQKTINQVTRDAVDLSAKQFIIDRIILEIKRYLGQGELTINEISNLMGFDEPSNLTKFFKRYEGISPTDFRKKYYLKII